MFNSLLQTKLYMPPNLPNLVERPRLLEKLATKPQTKLILVSAPAGYGKTTLVTTWLRQLDGVPVCWLSLDEDDGDPQQFFRYLAAVIRPLPNAQSSLPQLLQANQTIPARTLMKAFVHDLASLPTPFILVLDDYHAIDSAAIDEALPVLLDLMPPQMTLVLTSRSDPGFPISRLRARGELVELRADELRFTEAEAAQFLQQTMGLTLRPDQIAALENRTEGWIAGLQLAAISLQGHRGDVASFIDAFTGSHRFVLDYLLEEVLYQQPESRQTFLLHTSILDRLCGPLCDAVMGDSAVSGQDTLEIFERANLFLIPLDSKRRWYRYHRLFADLLRQRLQQQGGEVVKALHDRASQWYEDNNLELEAFHHAAAAHDIDRAARLMAGKGMPLHFRGAVAPVLNWLASLETAVLNARPSLWVMYASALSMTGQMPGVEEKLRAAEAALPGGEPDDQTRNLIGHIAAIRALIAALQDQVDTIIAQSQRALEYLHPDNLPVRTATIWKMGWAYQLQGNRPAASQAYTEAITISQATGNHIIHLSASMGLGQVQEAQTQLYSAAETYRRIVQLAGDPPLPIACEAHLGLARITYEWNDLEAAQQHGQQGRQLARPLENTDRSVACQVFLARLKLAQGDVEGAVTLLAEASQAARLRNFEQQVAEAAAVQVLALLRQGDVATAVALVQKHDLPFSQARVHLAQGDPAAALAVLAPIRQEAEAKGWPDARLKVLVLQALAHQAQGKKDGAGQLLAEALALAEPGGFIRLFIDEGPPMARLLSEVSVQGTTGYIDKLLAAFETGALSQTQPLVDPLSERELEILTLIAAGLKNKEIAGQLVISLNTVLYHAKNIYGKLGVNKRTQAVAKARELGLIQ
ncbi:MAG: AAA family ATPase [Anaerolineaceae bacterium]|nr:AAA family ATPase [Anaerolineaceae bacterium]